jgi:nucleoside-diphosphate-sugar epimerase|tara:strand:- start:428 stop:1345 length:918 start_codon:yes stop_codon:yes gene_type:complete
MKNVLVTGAAGFLGSHVCDELLSKGYTVVGVDNFFRGKKENVAKDVIFLERDLTLEGIEDLINLHNIDTVFHYAAINGTEHFYDIPAKVFNDNMNMTRNVLESITRGDSVKRIVYTSTSEVYGPHPPLPTDEHEPIILNMFSDRDSYASSKAIGEFQIKYAAKKLQISYLILRPFNTYGTRMDNTKYGQVVPEFFRKVYEPEFTLIGDGSQTRSFCHVDDHKVLAVRLAEYDSNSVVNIGNDEEITILDLAKKVHEIKGRAFEPKFLPPRDYDTQVRQPDIRKIRLLYPSYEFISIDDGLRRMEM